MTSIPRVELRSSATGPAGSGPTARKSWKVGTLTYTTGGLVAVFCWLLWGDFAWMLKDRSASPIVQIMLRKFDASDFLIGLFLLSLPAAIGLLLGPVISYRSDRHRGRWGRRIPYLLVTTPIAGAAMYGLAFSPAIGTWLHRLMGWSPQSLNLTIIVVIGLAWTASEIATSIANAVFGGLLNDVVPHDVLGRFYGLFRAVSLLTGIFFNYSLIGHARENYLPLLIGIGTIYCAGFILMCLRVKEGEYPPVETMETGQPAGLIVAVRTYVRDCFSQPYYLLVFATMVLTQMAMTPVSLYSINSAESFGLSMEAYGKYSVAMFVVSLVLSYPLGWMADRFHALRMAIGSLILLSAVMVVGFFGIIGPRSFGAFFLITGIIAGCYYTGAASLAQMLFPKLKFAQFVSASSLIGALVNIVFGPALGVVLDWLGHDYRYTFAVGGLIALSALLVSLMVYRRFMALGGTKAYVAP